MICSCLELVERIFEVAHCTVALIDTKSGQLVRYFPAHLSAGDHAWLTERAATMAGRVGQFKPIENTQDVALLGIDSSKVLVVGPEVLKDGSLAHFELKDLKYLNLLFQKPAGAPAESGVVHEDDKSSDEWLAGLFAAFGGDLRAAPVLHHNPYRIEQAIKEAVRLGDEQLLQHAFAIPVTGREGRLALDELRSLKNHANLVNVICSRAAIEGGVSYEDAFRLSDQLFLMVESLNSTDKAFEIRYAIAHAFTMLVQHHLKEHNKTEVNIKVQQAMLYIRQHIYDKITVASVAQAVNCHRNYLQRLFKRDTTFSVVSYIRSEKLKVVKELLAHSDESVSNIAALLNFSSPSHLCTVFKEQVHLTPEQYRRRHRAPG